MQFQAVCSKWNKKMTLSLTASSIEEARSLLHKQGYSIIEIQEVLDTSLLEWGNFFYFDTIINGVAQSGKIQSDDIFKAYRKLVEDLKYEVIFIYTSENMSEDQKKLITAKVKDGYNMYLESIGKKIDDMAQEKSKVDDEQMELSPQLLKEIEKYSKIIDETTIKIQNLLIKNHDVITVEQKSILERMEVELVQIKWLKNLWKLQSVLEESLKKIGAVEVELLKKGMIAERKKFLSETNKLLQWIGSSEKIQTEEEKKQDIWYQLNSLLGKISSSKKTEKSVSEWGKIDTNSFIYFKNKRELDIYKKASEKNNRAILSAIFSFKFSLLRRLILKRRLLKQNIQIIENRLSGKMVSYTKIAHGFGYYVDVFFSGIAGISAILSIGLFFYALLYISLDIFSKFWWIYFSLWDKSPFFLVLVSLLSLVFSFIRGFVSLIILIPIFFGILVFLSNNF